MLVKDERTGAQGQGNVHRRPRRGDLDVFIESLPPLHERRQAQGQGSRRTEMFEPPIPRTSSMANEDQLKEATAHQSSSRAEAHQRGRSCPRRTPTTFRPSRPRTVGSRAPSVVRIALARDEAKRAATSPKKTSITDDAEQVFTLYGRVMAKRGPFLVIRTPHGRRPGVPRPTRDGSSSEAERGAAQGAWTWRTTSMVRGTAHQAPARATLAVKRRGTTEHVEQGDAAPARQVEWPQGRREALPRTLRRSLGEPAGRARCSARARRIVQSPAGVPR